MATSVNKKTVRELGGEVWAEITQRQNGVVSESLIGDVDFRVTQELSDLVMGVLARHAGSTIVNDEDLPVTPLEDSSLNNL
jgi:hypothetical protein